MKKYIAPAIKVANVENEAILAASVGYNSAVSFGEEGKVGARGRRNDFIEDEFAEDFE